MKLHKLLSEMQQGPLQAWAKILSAQVEKGLDTNRYGDLPKWQAALDELPDLPTEHVVLDQGCLEVGNSDEISGKTLEHLQSSLKKFHPWRKGPFNLFGVHIDTEWRSDWKWDRLKEHIQPLAGRTVLDVGSGNGYHCWRMYAAGAKRVIGIDPTPLFVMQFEVLRKYIGDVPVNVLPLGIDDVPTGLQAFDSVFSMGVLYHRRSPIDHLLQLKDCLKPGGELVLETLVIDADEQSVLLPEGRYARMGNVWFIPSTGQLEKWLQRCKFTNIKVVDVNRTSSEEQRATAWMTFQSLEDFLDADDKTKTIEGYPAPRRAIVIAQKPA